MKLIYLTSQKYPSKKVEPFFIKSMAEAFAKILENNFILLVRGNAPEELKYFNSISINVPWRLRTVSYFFILPVFIFKHQWNNQKTIFFSSDPYLLSILIFWRQILGFNYHICSDWHQLFEDWRDRYIIKNSDYLVTTSKRLKKMLSNVCQNREENIVVSYGGVDLSGSKEIFKNKKEEQKKKLMLPSDNFLVGYVGGFKSVGLEKGIKTMIKALSFLDEKIIMVFVGGSKKEIEYYFALARYEKVGNRCLFIEKQPFKKVISYEQVMDLLVIPYPDKKHFRDYGFPMKVWEYLASGRPIVYSNLEIMAEILNGKAIAFQPGDSQSLAEVIEHIFRDKIPAEIQAKQNLEIVKNYTWHSRATNIINFIQAKSLRNE